MEQMYDIISFKEVFYNFNTLWVGYIVSILKHNNIALSVGNSAVTISSCKHSLLSSRDSDGEGPLFLRIIECVNMFLWYLMRLREGYDNFLRRHGLSAQKEPIPSSG